MDPGPRGFNRGATEVPYSTGVPVLLWLFEGATFHMICT